MYKIKSWDEAKKLPECQHLITEDEAFRISALLLKLSDTTIVVLPGFFKGKTPLEIAFEIWGDNPKGVSVILSAIWPERFQLLF